jgi:hypothetical protein
LRATGDLSASRRLAGVGAGLSPHSWPGTISFWSGCGEIQPRTGRFPVSHPASREILTVPFRRPIKPLYIRKLVKLIDFVERHGSTTHSGSAAKSPPRHRKRLPESWKALLQARMERKARNPGKAAPPANAVPAFRDATRRSMRATTRQRGAFCPLDDGPGEDE